MQYSAESIPDSLLWTLGCAIAATVSSGFYCVGLEYLPSESPNGVSYSNKVTFDRAFPLYAALPCFSRQHRMNIRT